MGRMVKEIMDNLGSWKVDGWVVTNGAYLRNFSSKMTF